VTLKNDDILIYNFCDDIIEKCHNENTQVSIFKRDDFQTCTKISGHQSNLNYWSLKNATNPKDGFNILLNQGEPCIIDPKQNNTIFYEMICNENMEHGKVHLRQDSLDKFDKNQCLNRLIFESFEACPKINFYAVWGFLLNYKVFFGAALIILGLLEAYLGKKLKNFTLFLTTCGVTLLFVFIFLFQFVIPNGANHNIIWIVLGISLAAGIILGVLISSYNEFLIGGLLGGYTGYFVGLLLYNLALNKIEANPSVSIN
jgi:hypothetical protein